MQYGGDVMMKCPFGGIFVAEEVEREQARFDGRETVTAGPMARVPGEMGLISQCMMP